jgi:hypothetical protein
MMIAFATTTLDPLGAFALELSPERYTAGNARRRVQRVPTLDGGVAVIDNGYTEADRTVSLDLRGQEADTLLRCRWLVTMYDRVLVFLPDGAYTAVPEALNEGASGVASMSLLLIGPAEVKA